MHHVLAVGGGGFDEAQLFRVAIVALFASGAVANAARARGRSPWVFGSITAVMTLAFFLLGWLAAWLVLRCYPRREPGKPHAATEPWRHALATTIVVAFATGGTAIQLRALNLLPAMPGAARATPAAAPPRASAAPAADRALATPVGHWPAVFSRFEREANPVPPADPNPRIGDTQAGEMSRAHAFYTGQCTAAASIERRFPGLAREIQLAAGESDVKFAAAIDNIDRLLTQTVADWPATRDRTSSQLIQQVLARKLTAGEAQTFLTELQARGRGRLPAPFLQTLLCYHPRYRDRPAAEYLDGFKREFRTDGSGKSAGLRMMIEHPESWSARPGRLPSVVQMITSENGHGFTSFTLAVMPLPPDLLGANVTEADMRGIVAERVWEQGMPGARTRDTSVVTLARRPAAWGEYDWTTQKVGITVHTHGLAFIFVERGAFVHLSFTTASDASPAVAEREFRRNGQLFQLMLNSFAVLP